jgi:hypothetical protein
VATSLYQCCWEGFSNLHPCPSGFAGSWISKVFHLQCLHHRSEALIFQHRAFLISFCDITITRQTCCVIAFVFAGQKIVIPLQAVATTSLILMRYHYETIGFIDKRRIRMTKHVPMTLFPTVRPFFTKNTSRLPNCVRSTSKRSFARTCLVKVKGRWKKAAEINAAAAIFLNRRGLSFL